MTMRPWQWAAWATVVAVLVGRVHVGADNPLDVECSAAVGPVIAGATRVVLAATGADEP